MNNNEYDDVLADRLTDALRAEASRHGPQPGSWSRFTARIDATAASGSRRESRHDAMASPHRRAAARWRIPLIAAAAVAIVVVATSAIITSGFGTDMHMAGPGDSTVGSEQGVSVPIAAAGEPVGPAGGGIAAGGVATDGSSPTSMGTSPATGATPGKSAGLVTMSFVDGRPPVGKLHGVFTVGDGAATSAGDHVNDGMALGYLSVFGDVTGGAMYLWGAVGPDVAQVQILSPLPPSADDIDPGFSGAGEHWTIDSGQGTSWSTPEATTTVWTDLAAGWHGFAVRLPHGAKSVTAIALGSSGGQVQARQFDTATGGSANLPTLPETGAPPVTATRKPPASASGPASSVDPSSIFVPNGCPIPDAEMGVGTPIGDAPSGQGMAFETNRDHSIVCLSNRGGTSWSLTLDGRPLLAAVIQATGIDNPLTPPVAGQKPQTGRYVWGVVDRTVASVSVNVDGKIIKAKLYALTTDLQPFLIQVPAGGALTVTATAPDGTVISSAHPEAPSS